MQVQIDLKSDLKSKLIQALRNTHDFPLRSTSTCAQDLRYLFQLKIKSMWKSEIGSNPRYICICACFEQNWC